MPGTIEIEFIRTVNLREISAKIVCIRNKEHEFTWDHLKGDLQLELRAFDKCLLQIPDGIATAILLNQLKYRDGNPNSIGIRNLIDRLKKSLSEDSKVKYVGLNDSLSDLVTKLELLCEGLDSWNLLEIYFTAGLIVNDLDLMHTAVRVFDTQIHQMLVGLEEMQISYSPEIQGSGEVRTSSVIELTDPRHIKEVLALRAEFFEMDDYNHAFLSNLEG